MPVGQRRRVEAARTTPDAREAPDRITAERIGRKESTTMNLPI
ncbi:MAG TPA: hypothetical protein VKB09_10975 [Thermomicrobiales bacterium]|nr:hypothetical protein [Thermomicrobiales bacterium]